MVNTKTSDEKESGLAVVGYASELVIFKANSKPDGKPQQLNLTKQQASDLCKMLAISLKPLAKR